MERRRRFLGLFISVTVGILAVAVLAVVAYFAWYILIHGDE